MRLAAAEHRFFHGVVGVGFTAKSHRLNEHLLCAICHPNFLYGHLVLGNGAGLIHAEDGDGPQRLHTGQLAHQRVFLCQPPRAQGEEHRKDDRKFFRNHGHCKRHTGKDAFNQTVGKWMIGNIEPGKYGHQRKQHAC